MFWTLAKHNDVFPHWEKDDGNVWKIVQTEDYGALSTFLSDKVDFKGDSNNFFLVLWHIYIRVCNVHSFHFFFNSSPDKRLDRYHHSNLSEFIYLDESK